MRLRMPAPDLRWDDLRVFLVAYRTRSLTRAAAKLGLNQSTMSRRLSALERTLDVRLFDRTPEGLIPTAVAERILPAAERAEAASHDALRALDGQARDLEGDVRLALSEGISYFGIAPLARKLRELHPGIVLHLITSNAIADLTRREADLALRFVRPERGDLIAKRLYEGPYALFASPDLLATLEPNAPIPVVAWDEAHAHLPEARWEASTGATVAARASTLTTRIALAQAACGAIGLPLALGNKLDGLTLVETVEIPLRWEAWLVTHRALRDVPRVRAVWDFVERALADLLA